MAIRVVWFWQNFCRKIEGRGLFRHLQIKLTLVYLLIFLIFDFWSYFLQNIKFLCKFWLNVHICHFFLFYPKNVFLADISFVERLLSLCGTHVLGKCSWYYKMLTKPSKCLLYTRSAWPTLLWSFAAALNNRAKNRLPKK